jgi:hypothetical protein
MKITPRRFIGLAILLFAIGGTLGLNAFKVFGPHQTYTIEFIRDVQLTDEAAPILSQVARYMLDHGDTHARVIGYAMPGGDRDADRTLSLMRAQTVTSEIVNRGIDGTRLSSVGLGGNEAPRGENAARVVVTVSK